MTPAESLSDQLGEAKEALGELAEGVDKIDKASPRLLWLEKQLNNSVNQLQAMLSDIEFGLSIQDLGYFGNEDFDEMIESIGIEIASLKGLIRTFKEVGR